MDTWQKLLEMAGQSDGFFLDKEIDAFSIQFVVVFNYGLT
jgi:hypothetical protein